MALYDAFDDITEPRRPQSHPFFSRLARTRRVRTVVLSSILIFLAILLTWRTSAGVSFDPTLSLT